jgi:molecular chaperone GrpE
VKRRREDIVQDQSEDMDAIDAEQASAPDADEAMEPVEAGFSRPETAEGQHETAERSLAEKERDEFRDLLLRTTAEFDNYRKRTERERQMLEETAAENLIHELLPLVDDLERALSAEAGEGIDAYRTGVELIHRRLLDILRRRGVEPIEALGAEFDPHYHQAVSY